MCIRDSLKRLLTEGGASAVAAADRFSSNVKQFGKMLKGMREGGSGIDRVTIPDSAGKLAELADLFKSLETETTGIVDKAPELVKVQNAAQGIADKADALQKAANRLVEQYVSTANDYRFFGLSLSCLLYTSRCV